MIREIQKQLIGIYKDLDEGFIIADDKNILYTNSAAAKLLQHDCKHRPIADSFEPSIANVIVERITSRRSEYLKNIFVAGNLCCGGIISVGGYGMIFLHKVDGAEEYTQHVDYKSKCIDAIAKYQKTVFDTVLMILNDGDVDVLKAKLLKKSHTRSLKANMTICELSKSIRKERNTLGYCDLTKLAENAVRNAVKIVPDLVISVENKVPNPRAFCQIKDLEIAVYSAISALSYSKKNSEITISVECINDQKLFVITGKDIVWSKEQIRYAYKTSCADLSESVIKYGYDVIRATNLLENQGGEILVKVTESDTSIVLILPDAEPSNDLVMQSGDEEFLSEDEAYIALGDIIE